MIVPIESDKHELHELYLAEIRGGNCFRCDQRAYWVESLANLILESILFHNEATRDSDVHGARIQRRKDAVIQACETLAEDWKERRTWQEQHRCGEPQPYVPDGAGMD